MERPFLQVVPELEHMFERREYALPGFAEKLPQARVVRAWVEVPFMATSQNK
jgi:hypothetical protein